METRTIPNNRKFIRESNPTRNENKRVYKSTNLRLSNIDLSDKVQPVKYDFNKCLLRLNQKHSKSFDPNVKLYKEEITDYLVNTLSKEFNISNCTSISLTDNKAIIYQSLKYDFYFFDLSKFLKLEKTSPKLFISFFSLIKNVGISFLEEESFRYFSREDIDIYSNNIEEADMEKNLLDNSLEILKSIENESKSNSEIYKILKNYKPKKKIFLEIKRFILNYLNERFIFNYSFPYEYYVKGEDLDKLDEDFEKSEIYERIGAHITSSKILEEVINQSMQNTFNHFTLYNPCWTITEEKAETNLRDNITLFEKFTKELITIKDLL